MRFKFRPECCLIFLAAFLGACAPYGGTRVGAALVVGGPPPPLRYEVALARPGPRHVWVSGFWDWRPGARDYVWIPGHWVLAPRPAAVWVAPRYERRRGGWVFFRGYWR